MSEFDEIPKGKENIQEYDFSLEALQDEMLSYTRIKETPQEQTEFKDAREYKVAECAEIAKQHFSYEVLCEWEKYPMEKRVEVVNNYVQDVGKELGANVKEVVVEHLSDAYGYNKGDGIVHLNIKLLKDPALLVKLIDTAAHETRHQFQFEAVQNPEKYGLDDATAKEWKVGLENYTTCGATKYDPWGYFYNPVETDARFFGESMVRELTKGIITDHTPTAQKSEAIRSGANIELKASKYDDNEWNIKEMESALRRGDLSAAKKHAGRIHK